MRLIGQKWKRGDTWSGLILIGRGLILYTFLTIESISDLVLKESPILSIPFEEIRSLSEVESGDNGKEVTPVPMPNTAVKLFCADGSWRLPPARVGRCRATARHLNRCLFLLCAGSKRVLLRRSRVKCLLGVYGDKLI